MGYVMEWTADGYVAVVTMFNYQQFRHISTPGWHLGWTWAKKEVIWSMVGAQTTEQGDCSKFKSSPPHCCKRDGDPTIVDLLPGTPYNQQIANCCKAEVINTFNQDPSNAASSFQVNVGLAGTTNKTVKVPKNFTLKAPGPGYTCGRLENTDTPLFVRIPVSDTYQYGIRIRYTSIRIPGVLVKKTKKTKILKMETRWIHLEDLKDTAQPFKNSTSHLVRHWPVDLPLPSPGGFVKYLSRHADCVCYFAMLYFYALLNLYFI